MSYDETWADWDLDDEALDREAVKALVERHRDEYDELVGQTRQAEIDRLKEQAAEAKRRISALEAKLARSEAARERSKERIATGVTKRRRSK